MEKIWLSQYPDNVSGELPNNFSQQYPSLLDLLAPAFIDYKDNLAYANFGKVLTYGQLAELTDIFAAFLQNELRVKKGDRLAIMLPNILQHPVALFGAFKAGLTIVNVNPLYTPRELEYQLKDSGASVIVVLENVSATLAQVLPQTDIKRVITTRIGDLLSPLKGALINFVVKHIKSKYQTVNIPGAITFNQALKLGKQTRYTPVNLSADDIAFLQYTGGTTGVSKGAILTHRNMVANVLQAKEWLQQRPLTLGKEVIVTALPLYHVFSLTANTLTFMSLGALNLLITNPRDMSAFVKELSRYPFSVITGVNTLFNGLLHHPAFEKLDFSHLKISLAGGMALQKVVANRWLKVTGNGLIEAYGLTETSPAAMINRMDLKAYNGCIGYPLSSTSVKVCDDDGHELPLGQAGELCIYGPQVMRSYWNKPEETAKVLSDDGWLKTGDMAIIEADGLVRLVDRKKDMILVSGFNVYPNEIEAVVALLPGVKEVAAIGIPDPNHGEVVKLFVVKDNPKLTKEEILNYCHLNLTGYKMPHIIEFRDDLPKTNVGKILRRALRDV